MMKKLVALFGVIFLAACAQTPPQPVHPELTFSHLPPVSLSVSSINVVDQTQKKQLDKTESYVDYRFPTSPKKAIENWVRDRLVANGSSGTATVIIQDAFAIEQKLKTKTGIKGVFTNDQSERYVAGVEVRLEIRDPSSRLMSDASAKAGRSITVAEDATLYEREKQWVSIVENMMADFDKVMLENMSKFAR
jgi:hypothetical protein